MGSHLYRLDLAYLGKPFVGFQCQPCGGSVQDHVEKALSTILSHQTKTTGASRTDSGVNAEHQVLTFRSDKKLSEETFLRSVNSLTPREIGVYRLQKMDEDFHPILSATSKIYRYRLWKGFCYNPFAYDFVWEVPRSLDVTELRKSSKIFVGTHDFTSFCNSDTDIKTKERKILEIRVEQKDELIEVWFHGEGFLKQMIRILVGSLVDVGLGKTTDAELADILLAKDRTKAGVTAPGNGLSLIEINYGNDIGIDACMKRSQKGICIPV